MIPQGWKGLEKYRHCEPIFSYGGMQILDDLTRAARWRVRCEVRLVTPTVFEMLVLRGLQRLGDVEEREEEREEERGEESCSPHCEDQLETECRY